MFRALRRLEYLVVSGGDVLERWPHLTVAEARAKVLSGYPKVAQT